MKSNGNACRYERIMPDSAAESNLIDRIFDGEDVFVGGVSGKELVHWSSALKDGRLEGLGEFLAEANPGCEVHSQDDAVGISYGGMSHEELIRHTTRIHDVAEMLAFLSHQYVLESMPINSLPAINFTFRPEPQYYFKIQGNCYAARQEGHKPISDFNDLARYLSNNVGLTDRSVETVIMVLHDRLVERNPRELIMPMGRKKSHDVIVARVDGKLMGGKIHTDETKAFVEQGAHFHLPKNGCDYIIPSHIEFPGAANGLYLTLANLVPVSEQIYGSPGYYLDCISHMSRYGLGILEKEGVDVPDFVIPRFDDAFEAIRFSEPARRYISIVRLAERANEYEEAREMLEASPKELIHNDLFMYQIIGPYINDLEHLSIGPEAISLSSWWNDPDRRITSNQRKLEEFRYGRDVSLVDAAILVRSVMSCQWNALTYQGKESDKKFKMTGELIR